MVPPTTEMLIGEALLRVDEMEQLVTKLDEETKENIANLERRNDAKMQKLEQSVEAVLRARVVQLEAQNAHLQRQMQLMAEQMAQVQRLVLPKQAGLSCSEARRAGMNVRQARSSGYEPREVWEAGFTCAEARQAGFTCAEARQAGYTCAEARQAGYVEGLKQAGYTCAEAKQAGYTCAEAKRAGYVEGLKEAGYTCAEAKRAGYSPQECSRGGYSFHDGESLGYGRGRSPSYNEQCWRGPCNLNHSVCGGLFRLGRPTCSYWGANQGWSFF